ncbi:K+-dependent Na+/Ca+ exchanger related-protein [Azotobacter vinelandii CA]|uniref:K+-dependent Na+/Ca+ exchanger related-protein n=3 Tax=Azotobacter group TaxID=351 RepID=C1DQ34_AZOVD|nr:K+-dependent Na+/Ca+ exchanger related-protein [Azotobacter vinelandii DJ]AGK17037.1 K+-dependent Na+/Ca+ exchanger related-protein [Azotobacter vinelandii CA]AGK19832.1 K+-dependent Na+/Ca+ exchanger related-protein [Azotobacter vinelandii CA6]GLK60956.1 sodium:calcium antiporter [Azotobacter vinelandii]
MTAWDGPRMNPLTFICLIAGLALLIAGAEALVRGAARLAARFGIPPLIIGLTVVAFGTSAPEMAVSVRSASGGQGDIAVGNAIGSNIFNVLMILGLSALVIPLRVSRQLIRFDVPVMIGVSLLAWLLAIDREYGRPDGALLFAGILAYIAFQVRSGLNAGTSGDGNEFETEFGRKPEGRLALPGHLALVALGLAMLVWGSDLLIDATVTLARALGLSELAIGLTMVAAGTSLPELATSLVAAIKGERDIAVGNIVGSNIFNLLAVLGLAALVSPAPIEVSPNALAFDYPVMIAAAAACLPIFLTGYRIGRWEGLLFFGYYLAYGAYQVLFASGASAVDLLHDALAWYALPLTAVTLLVIAVRGWRQRG